MAAPMSDLVLKPAASCAYDLIALAFETDTTRSAAYQVTAEDGVGICDRFPTILGFGRGGGAETAGR